MKKVVIAAVILILTTKILAYADHDRYNLEDITDSHGAIILIIDAESGNIIDSNTSAEFFYGYSKEELRKMNVSEINMLSDKEIKAEISLAIEEKRNYFIFRHKLKNGSIRYVEVYSSPAEDNYGKPILLSIIHDITTSVESEKENERNRIIIIGLLSFVIIGMSILIYYINISKNRERLSKRRFKSLFENMEEGFALHKIICDSEGRPEDYIFLEVNEAFENIMDLKSEDIVGRKVREVLPDTEEYWIEKYGEVALSRKSASFTNYLKPLNKHFSVNAFSPNEMEFAVVFTDITEQINATRKAELERNFFKTVLHSLGDGVISTDKDGKIDLMNIVAENLTGWKIEDAKGRAFEDVFKIVNEFTRKNCENPVKQVLALGEMIELENNTILIKKNGYEIPVEDSAAPIKNDSGEVVGAVVVFRDYTEKKDKQNEIVYLSYHDQLTGLYNRRYFEEEIRRLDTERNLPISIAMVDVNGLKLTNDAFGHIAGDRLLKKVSKLLKTHCRSDDIIARIGGDEFVILFPQTSGKETEQIVKRIYAGAKSSYLEQMVISVSIGFATKKSVDQSITDIFTKAEEYMYRKKLTESQSMRSETIKAILQAVNEKSEREQLHAERVSEISKEIGIMLGVSQDVLEEIEIAGLMHDIGKIVLDDNVLNKDGELTEEEYAQIKRHPEGSYHILRSVDSYTKLADYVLSHHERWDGNGYPRGISGERIPFISRIIAIADAFEAMTSERPYRETLSEEEAILEIKNNSGTQFDPKIAEIFIQKYSKFMQ